jgi:hypothetical protein
MTRKLRAFLLLGIIIYGLTACSLDGQKASTYYIVDPRFEELYEQLNGDDILGPPISNKKYVSNTRQEKQYFEGGVLVFDPDATPRLWLYPVGRDAGFSDIPNSDPENPSVKYVNGFVIPQEFAKIYDELGGDRWVGAPLTRARFNPEKNRVEQYFENLGFFRYENDPVGVVHTMPYGLWKCAGECAMYPGVENAAAGQSVSSADSALFGQAAAHFGAKFTGEALSQPYLTEEGLKEQIFEHVVLVEDLSSPFGVRPRAISQDLESFSDQLQKPRSDAQDYFREVTGGKGYYIPAYFLDFIDRYAGFEFSGEPVTRKEEIRAGVFRQCFESYCLLYDSLAPEGQRVKLEKLGKKYQSALQSSAPEPQIVDETIQNLKLDIWEQSPQISSIENQQLGVCIHEGNQPQVGMTAVLILSIPGQEAGSAQFEPTDNGGCSFLNLDPIQAQNGTTVDYQVCIQDSSGRDICQRDSFVIWGNQEEAKEENSKIAIDQTAATDQRSTQTGNYQSVMDLWELKPQISSQEYQEIGACVHQGNQPQVGLQSSLKLTLPHSKAVIYYGAPSDQGGCTFFRLDPVSAKNGETVPYEVCFSGPEGEKVCQQSSFLIWGNP